MKYTNVYIDAIGYEIAPVVVSSAELEARLSDVYEALHLGPGQLEALTGIGERLNSLTSPLFGADAYLDKPFELGDLDRAIADALGGEGGAPAAEESEEPDEAPRPAKKPAAKKK